jgi:hypothetical protein
MTSFIIQFLDLNLPEIGRIHQQSLTDGGFDRYRKPIRRNQFVAKMERLFPGVICAEWSSHIDPIPEGVGHPKWVRNA